MKRWLGTTLVISGTLLLALAATGCGGSDQSFEDTQWTLAEYVGADGNPVAALPTPEVTATFSGGEVQGSGGCNTYRGAYELDGTNISISPLASTMMACDQPILDQETAFFAAMDAAASYRIDDGDLVLSDDTGETVLVFSQSAE